MADQEFYKYHGAGNDFILIDNRSGALSLDATTIAQWCHRHYGVGADGLMLLEAPRALSDHFYMQYFNSDGNESTMCVDLVYNLKVRRKLESNESTL